MLKTIRLLQCALNEVGGLGVNSTTYTIVINGTLTCCVLLFVFMFNLAKKEVKSTSFNLYYAYNVLRLTFTRNSQVLIERTALGTNNKEEQRSNEAPREPKKVGARRHDCAWYRTPVLQ